MLKELEQNIPNWTTDYFKQKFLKDLHLFERVFGLSSYTTSHKECLGKNVLHLLMEINSLTREWELELQCLT